MEITKDLSNELANAMLEWTDLAANKYYCCRKTTTKTNVRRNESQGCVLFSIFMLNYYYIRNELSKRFENVRKIKIRKYPLNILYIPHSSY